MSDKKVWFITGSSRGLGVDLVKSALAAAHRVVATGRDKEAVKRAIGLAQNLLVLQLDVTRFSDAEAAEKIVVERFGRIDVLVNNAGNFLRRLFRRPFPRGIGKANLGKPVWADECYASNLACYAKAEIGTRYNIVE